MYVFLNAGIPDMCALCGQTMMNKLLLKKLGIVVQPHQHFLKVHLWSRKGWNAVNNTPTLSLVRLRKSKSCQNHLELHIWLPNYVLLTVRTEKSRTSLFNQLPQGGHPKWLFYNVKIAEKVTNLEIAVNLTKSGKRLKQKAIPSSLGDVFTL